MNLREIGHFNYNKEVYFILESKEKDRFGKVYWNYYLARKNYGMITHVIGYPEKDNFDSMRDFIKQDMAYYAQELHDGLILFDLLQYITDETTVCIWRNGDLLGTYDGKDSIDECYNFETVLSVSAGQFKIDIDI